MPLRPSRTSEHSGGERQCSKVRLEPYSRTNREQDVRNDTGRKSKQRICVDALRIIVFGRQGPEVRILSPRPVSFAIIGPCNLARSEEHTSELQSLMRISYAVFCLKKNKSNRHTTHHQSNVSNQIN